MIQRRHWTWLRSLFIITNGHIAQSFNISKTSIFFNLHLSNKLKFCLHINFPFSHSHIPLMFQCLHSLLRFVPRTGFYCCISRRVFIICILYVFFFLNNPYFDFLNVATTHNSQRSHIRTISIHFMSRKR